MKALLTLIAALAACGAASACTSPSKGPPIESATAPTGSPRDYVREKLRQALARAGSTAQVDLWLAHEQDARALMGRADVVLDPRPGSFSVVVSDGVTRVVGSDETGVMYGALELIDRLVSDGAGAIPPGAPFSGAPATAIRGANLLLGLPEPGETDWWFHDESFWEQYLDLLARARMNFLDLHGMYELPTTLFPNLLPHFAVSASFPAVGAPAAVRQQNLEMLNRIIAMAADRGIRVGVMSYSAETRVTSTQGVALVGAERAIYEREAVADLAARAPGLWQLGFRIGESMEDADFFLDTFIKGVQSVAPTLGIYLRTWLVDKSDVLAISAATAGNLLVEVKYNGEHLGPSYLITGGLMGELHEWSKYSYEDYLSPPTPYDLIFQIWSGGTHRLFRHANFEDIRQTIASARLGVSAGFTLLAPHAFTPQRDFYHRLEADRFSPWSFRRDELEYLMFGRLAYDPGTDEAVFRAALAARTGTEDLWSPLQAAGRIVPWIQAAHTCGPDSRHFAPDLEWGGSVGFWASAPETGRPSGVCKRSEYHGSFDIFAVASAHDTAHDLLARRPTTRLSSLEVAREVLEAAAMAREAASVAIDVDDPEARDVVRECVALADLGEYFGHKLRGATALAVYDGSGREDYLEAAIVETAAADAAWAQLGADTQYIAPFRDRLRMVELGYPLYHFSYQSLEEDLASIERSMADAPAASSWWDELPPAKAWLDTPRGDGPGLVALFAQRPPDGPEGRLQVTACLAAPAPADADISLLWKPFAGDAEWRRFTAAPLPGPTDGPCAGACMDAGCSFGATLDGLTDGAYFALEIAAPGGGWRYPDVRRGAPYIAVPPVEP